MDQVTDPKPKRTRAPRRSQGVILAEKVSSLSVTDFIEVQKAVKAYHAKLQEAVAS